MIVHLIDLKNESVENIIGKSAWLIDELNGYGIIELRPFFLRYPSAWYELKRKLHSMYDQYKGKIPKEAEEKVLSVFLRLWRTEIDPATIEHIWRKEILENRWLTTGISREPSLLDSSHGMLNYLELRSQKDQVGFVRKMIEAWIRSNLDNDLFSGDSQGKDDFYRFFKSLFPHVLQYLKDIFSIDVPSDIGNNIENVAKWVASHIWGRNHSGIWAKNAWMLVKAFRAWWAFESIQKQYEEAREWIQHIPQKMKDHGIPFRQEWVRKEKSFQDEIEATFGSAEIELSTGKIAKVHIEYRAKSLRSILLKMWENEDYNNIDANRDTIGLAVVWEDGLTEEEKVDIFSLFSNLFADKGYILKNKGAFDEGALGKLKTKLKSWEKRPLGTSVTEKKKKSSKDFRNISYSGFTKILGTNTWIEVQGFDKSAYDFWKTEHYEFDPLKIISAWSRWSWFLTPIQTLNTVRQNIDRDILESKIKKRPQWVIWDYIQEGRLLAYRWKNDEIYMVPRQHEKQFESKFSHAALIAKSDKVLKSFIDTLSSETSHWSS